MDYMINSDNSNNGNNGRNVNNFQGGLILVIIIIFASCSSDDGCLGYIDKMNNDDKKLFLCTLL